MRTDGMRSGFSPVSDRRGIFIFYLCPGSGLFHKVFLQSQCVKEGCPADPEYGIILRIEKRKGKEENDIEMQAHCSASGFVRAAAGLPDDGGSAGESG